MSDTVLIVDDEDAFCEALSVALEKEGFETVVARDGIEALDAFDARQPDIVLLDVMLPRLSGIDVCRKLRQDSAVPIIMVSARDDEVDTVVGLEVGADDYVSKPYKLRELVARIRANLRRAPDSGEPGGLAATDAVEAGGVAVDPERHEARVRGEQIRLTLKEFELLYLLVDNRGKVVPREVILERVWGPGFVGDTKTLDVHIRRLRAKVEQDHSEPVLIRTIRGLGYKFDA
ncbi:MAG: response regulator transcription factor [Acidimicrobiia bacterium]